VPFPLDWSTPPEWVARVEAQPLLLLSDHAHCEALSRVAIDELEHFRAVLICLRERGGRLMAQDVNPYAEALLGRAAATRSTRFLDRLLIAELIEARSLERFHLLAEHMADPGLAHLYRSLMASEAGHRALFEALALELYGEGEVRSRQAELRDLEGQVMADLPFDYRVHSGMGER
jgi:tRNA 2-(methylsulfanyl)-N6-isopentenyladenosine37 hydroxylase